jgi:kynurenine formamidase
MVGRGVLLDVARMMKKDVLDDGFAITPEILDDAEKHAAVSIRRGDYLLVRTGHLESKLAAKSWDGYAGGAAPGLSFETLDWLQAKQVAAIATDTWAVEVRPHDKEGVVLPFHWISIPIMGLTLGEIFSLGELARDCSDDGQYEFMFVAPVLPITGAVGSPTNPLAIK